MESLFIGTRFVSSMRNFGFRFLGFLFFNFLFYFVASLFSLQIIGLWIPRRSCRREVVAALTDFSVIRSHELIDLEKI